MNTPTVRELRDKAPAPVRRQKKNLLRRHWLSGALFFGLLGFMGYTGMNLYEAELKLQEVRKTRAELDEAILESRHKNQQLKEQLQRVSEDAFMELMAKNMGFAYPNETMYQTGSDKGR